MSVPHTGEAMPGHARAALVEACALKRMDAATGAMLLDGVSLTLHAGECSALMGPSGVGKSLLLRALALLDAVDAGGVLWRGRAVAPRTVPHYRRDVAYVSQRPAMLEGSVEDNLRYPFTLGVYRDARFHRADVLALLARAERGAAFLDKQTTTLSGGELQIAALVRVLQMRPSALLLDEPTAALDPASASAVEHMVSDWFDARRAERAVLWVTHDAAQAARVATRQLRLDRAGLRSAEANGP